MKELEDHKQFPSFLRNFQTEFIGFIVSAFNVYDAFVRHLKTLNLPLRPMADLCSGSGEPAVSIFRKSDCFSSLSLSDKFPNQSLFSDKNISYEPKSMDVLEMEFGSGKCYTMFNSFHHFKDDDKLKIAEKIHSSGSIAFIVEIIEPTILCLLKIMVVTTIGNLLLTPFVKPYSFKRLLFTYLIPVNLFTIAFDGVVSVFKSRTVLQYQKLFIHHRDTIQVFKLKNVLSPLIVVQIHPGK